MGTRTTILVAIALLTIVGVVGCGGSDKPTAPVDTVPPAAVVGLDGWVNTGEAPSVTLQWKAGAELDLAGYRVYRIEDGGSPQLVATISTARYLDKDVEGGATYVYEVAPFDEANNEGVHAATSSLKVEGGARTQAQGMD